LKYVNDFLEGKVVRFAAQSLVLVWRSSESAVDLFTGTGRRAEWNDFIYTVMCLSTLIGSLIVGVFLIGMDELMCRQSGGVRPASASGIGGGLALNLQLPTMAAETAPQG